MVIYILKVECEKVVLYDTWVSKSLQPPKVEYYRLQGEYSTPIGSCRNM